MHTPSEEKPLETKRIHTFTASKSKLPSSVKSVDSDEELIESISHSQPIEPEVKYERLNAWQKSLLEMKNAARVSSEDIAEFCGLSKSVVNTNLYTARASPRADITTAIKTFYNESLMPAEQEIQALLLSDISKVYETWAKALGLAPPSFDDPKASVDFYKKISSILMIHYLTLDRWAEGAQRPTYSKLRKYHRLIMNMSEQLKSFQNPDKG